MVSIFPLGGIGGVTKNLFVYECGNDMMIVDCGIGFPDEGMPGVEFLIPDSQYLLDRIKGGATLHGIVLTHGHDDHIAALPYILREIGVDVPIYGSPLTAEFAMSRMEDNGVVKEVTYFDEGKITVGPFEVETVRVTHSIPDTRHLVIHTPEGVIYHGSDFKLDLTPVDGIPTDLQHIARIGSEGVLCALIDCLRIERPLPTPSESSITQTLRSEMRDVDGKIIVTLMSSSIHRIQQVINVAAEYGRYVTFIGRSVEQNVNTAMNMGLLDFPANIKLNKRSLTDVQDKDLVVVIAGSQGQPGSSLDRAVFGQHRYVSLRRGDKIIFSSEPIPGSEKNVYRTINEISAQGIEVVYSDLRDALHVSGHASEYEQMLLLQLLRPQYAFPIGGEERHRVRFALTVQKHGYQVKQVVLPEYGKVVEFENGKMKYGKKIALRERTVDGSGIASVVGKHLDERELLGKNGALVVSLVEDGGAVEPARIAIDTRGITIGHEHTEEELFESVRMEVARVLNESDLTGNELRVQLEKALVKIIEKQFGMSPLVMVVMSSVE